jgi:hypothetical protein
LLRVARSKNGDRDGFEALQRCTAHDGSTAPHRPAVLTEFPTPGATVAPGFAFKGLANVFEGTVNFELLDPANAVIARGFATVMMGAWG